MGLFSTPIEQSSIDPQYRSLDGYRWSEVLDRWDYRSPALRRYLDYCCRDDFGVVASEVSAWAGVHYFAGRRGVGANCPDGALLSWPAGNGHLVEQFERRLLPHLCTGQLVRFIQKQSPWRIRVQDVNDLTQERWHEIRADHLIWAAPRFVASRVLQGWKPGYLDTFRRRPWLVANLALDSLPQGLGAPLSWDNVPEAGLSLGYVVANHQAIFRAQDHPTVLTYYLPLGEETTVPDTQPRLGREHTTSHAPVLSQMRSADAQARFVIEDLQRMHPRIVEQISQLETWIWGHGMSYPPVGFMWGEARRRALADQWANFAHSEMSGISLFEEAQYWGVEAAQRVLIQMRRSSDGKS